jgi:superoxide dismutase, Fe-Mn family
MFKLPSLPYSYDALEPYIDAKTMEIHYTKHHQAYVNALNKTLEPYPNLQKMELSAMLSDLSAIPEEIRISVRNFGGGDYNHSLFWQYMKKNGGGQPKGMLADALAKTFGSFEAFKEHMSTTARMVFGSGWAWLVLNKQGECEIMPSFNQDTPISKGIQPLLCIDVWEHAYYLKYQNRRPDYIDAWWHVINWDFVEDTFQTLKK